MQHSLLRNCYKVVAATKSLQRSQNSKQSPSQHKPEAFGSSYSSTSGPQHFPSQGRALTEAAENVI